MSRLVAIALTASLLAAPPAQAHPDYEHAQVVRDGDGRAWQLVLHYTDGILTGDPVSLIVRDAGGGTVSKTEFARQVCLWGCRAGTCTVFRYALGWSPFPENVWRFEAGKLEPHDTVGMRALGVLVPLLNDPIGYGFWLGLFFAPIVLHVQARRLRKGLRIGARTVLWVAATPCLALWFYLSLVSQLSPLLVLALIAVFSAGWLAWRTRQATAVRATG
jgi:hypothetical protein